MRWRYRTKSTHVIYDTFRWKYIWYFPSHALISLQLLSLFGPSCTKQLCGGCKFDLLFARDLEKESESDTIYFLSSRLHTVYTMFTVLNVAVVLAHHHSHHSLASVRLYNVVISLHLLQLTRHAIRMLAIVWFVCNGWVFRWDSLFSSFCLVWISTLLLFTYTPHYCCFSLIHRKWNSPRPPLITFAMRVMMNSRAAKKKKSSAEIERRRETRRRNSSKTCDVWILIRLISLFSWFSRCFLVRPSPCEYPHSKRPSERWRRACKMISHF